MKKKVKPSNILKLAKKYLWNGEGSPYGPYFGDYGTLPYVCVCIEAAGADLDAREVATKIKNKINKALGAGIAPTIQEWLAQKHGVETWKYSHIDFQQYRHRWLDHMIREFKKAGQ